MRVSHTCLLVTDLERALGFYRLLGFEERRRLGDGDRLTVFCGLPGDSDQLQLACVRASAEPSTAFGHLAIEVDDLDAMLGVLAQHAIMPDDPPTSVGALRLCFVPDPDGYTIELIEGSA